jgi:hypothetical protein
VTRRTRLTLWLTTPVFIIVVVLVRAVWLAYLRTLSLAELHIRIFDHSTGVATAVWTVCIVLTAVIVWALTGVLIRRSDRNHSSAA